MPRSLIHGIFVIGKPDYNQMLSRLNLVLDLDDFKKPVHGVNPIRIEPLKPRGVN